MIYRKVSKNSNRDLIGLINEYKNQPLLVESCVEESEKYIVTFLFIYKNIFLTLENLYLKNKEKKEVNYFAKNSRFGEPLIKKVSKEEFLNYSFENPDFSEWILFNIDKII